MDFIHETLKIAIEVRERQAYNIISMSGASIGFAVVITIKDFFELSQIPLALAVLCWSICIAMGFILTDKVNDMAIGLGDVLLSYSRGISSENNKSLDEFLELEKISNQQFKYQRIIFFIGIMLFIVWHLWEMAKNSSST